MRGLCALCGLFLAIAIVNCSPVVKRETPEEDLSPLNEVYVVEVDNDKAADGERGDREKRKIGLSLGVTNGIMNFVFGKLDSFLDANTRALTILDESNRAKNVAFGIDPTKSATSEFLGKLVSQKIQAATGSIGPLISSATTLLSGASAGLSNAVASKFAPLSALSGGLSGGSGSAGAGGAGGGAAGSALIGNILTTKINTLLPLSQSLSGGSSGGSGGILSGGGGGTDSDASTKTNDDANGGGIGGGLAAFTNLAGRRRAITTTTTEDTPVFDRNKVSLEIPSAAFGTGFTLVTNISKVLSSVIMNSAKRTETFLEIFKPLFRGVFAIKGLPSDNPN